MIDRYLIQPYNEDRYRAILSSAVNCKWIAEATWVTSPVAVQEIITSDALLIALHYWVNTGKVDPENYSDGRKLVSDPLTVTILNLASMYEDLLESGDLGDSELKKTTASLARRRKEKSGILGTDWRKKFATEIDVCMRLRVCAADAGLPEDIFFGSLCSMQNGESNGGNSDDNSSSAIDRLWELYHVNINLRADERSLALINPTGRISASTWAVRELLEAMELTGAELGQVDWFPHPYVMIRDILGVTGIDVNTNRIKEVVMQLG